MAVTIIMAFTLFFMWGSVVFTYKAVENGKYFLGITLPVQYRRENEVLEIAEDYQRVMKKINLTGLIACVPVLLVSDYLSFAILLLMIWFGALIYFHQENVERCARSLYRVKQNNGWLAGNAHVVRIDTALSGLKDKGAVSFWWMIPAYLIGLAGCSFAGQGAVFSFVGAELSFLLIYTAARKARPQVICDDTAVNQKMDRIMRREWTRCMVLHSYGMAAFAIILGWLADKNDTAAGYFGTGNFRALGLFVLLGAVGSAGTIYVTWNNVKKVREQIYFTLSDTETEVYGDDDEYWLNGYPAGMHPTGFVEKRIGIGRTTNASLKGGALDKAVWILTGIFVVGISLFLMPFDFAQVKMEIADGNCRVSAASMGYSFDLEDVEQIMLMPERPSMSKKHGYDSNRLLLGDFRVQGYGTCKVFVYRKNSAVIKVDTKDGILWFNGESREETCVLYEELVKRKE